MVPPDTAPSSYMYGRLWPSTCVRTYVPTGLPLPVIGPGPVALSPLHATASRIAAISELLRKIVVFIVLSSMCGVCSRGTDESFRQGRIRGRDAPRLALGNRWQRGGRASGVRTHGPGPS